MLVLCRRHRGRMAARMFVYCGWAASTLTILVIFITALDGYQNYDALPWDSADSAVFGSETLMENEVVETPNRRRSLSAEDSESNTALEIGRADEMLKRRVRRHQRLGRLLFKGGVSQDNGSSFLSDGVPPSKMDSGKADTVHSTTDDFSAHNIRPGGGKKTRKRLPTSRQAKERKVTLEIQTQVAKPERVYERSRNAKVDAMGLSSMDRESQISKRNLRLEEMPTASGTNDSPMMNGHLPVTQIQMPDIDADVAETKVSASSADGIPLVEDVIFWSRDVEQLVPAGISDDNVIEFRDAVSRLKVRSMEDPQWNRCGRPKNQFVVLEDGTPLCARYRFPQETLIRGEILSFHLSRLLALDNVPAVILSQLNASDPLWLTQNFTAVQWSSGSFVALIQWMDDLNHEKSRVRIPRVLLSSYESGVSMTAGSLDRDQLTADQLTSLLQWTDLILFDYITGHYDRVASMQDGAEREMKPSIMSESIRNLRQIRGNGKFILIDNESGLFDGYELMYHGAQTGLQFLGFHRRLLRSTCVFRRRTVARIRWLAAKQHPERVLEEYANFREPLYRKLKETPEAGLFRTYFRVRLKEVVDWIDYCDSLRPR